MKPALDGVRILELTTMITGPLAGQLLGDLGASIIKVESRDGGDPFRNHSGGLYGGHFCAYNRNKRSITLDLKTPQGKTVFLDLVGRSDVLIENFRPGVLDRLGLSHKELMANNPRLIHASITGFGSDGPYRDRPSYDAVAQGLAGVLTQFLDPADPQPAGPTLSDNITGYYCAYGVLGALYQREKTGKGCLVENSMLESTIAFAPDGFINNQRHGAKIGPLSRVTASQSYAFRCADGKLIAIHLSSPPKFWEGLVKALERPDLGTHPEYGKRQGRIAGYKGLRQELQKTFVTRPRSEWAQRLEANDVPYAPVYDVTEVLDDPQVKHQGTFSMMHHPAEGDVLCIATPVRFDGERPRTMTAPPTIGEHTREILAELGRSSDEIAALEKAKAV